MYKNCVKLSRNAAGVLVLMLGIVLDSAAQYDFMGIRYKGDTVEIPRAKPYKSGKSIPSLDFSIDSIRPLDELFTGNGEGYPWLSPDGNRIYYTEGTDTHKIYIAEKKTGEYKFNNSRPLSIYNGNKNINIHTYSAWLTNDELNIYFIQTSAIKKSYSTLYHAKRDSINQGFSQVTKVKLIANNLFNFVCPSFTQDLENMFLFIVQDTNYKKVHIICRFIKISEDEYEIKDTMQIPDNYQPGPGMLTSDDFNYYLSIIDKTLKKYSLYLFIKDSLLSKFNKVYYINNSIINDSSYIIGHPYASISNNLIIFVKGEFDYWISNKLYIAYNLKKQSITNEYNNIIKEVNISPNPVSNKLYISFVNEKKTNIKIEIFNIMGKHIASLLNENIYYGKHSIEYNTLNLVKGIYLIKITDNKNEIMKKIVKI
ncbi:MAG: T9SS type A sorting domain-containing protein [Bacteroidales bacterium]|nr:T9SS type A sorting domain-containing protein [Bacteroidales bacterium]